MQQSEGSAERSEWQSKPHLNLWPEPTRKRRPLPKRISPRQFRDFCRRLNPAGNPDRPRDGRAVRDVLHDPIFGIALIIQTMNEWLTEFARRPDCILVRYEDLHVNPTEQFRRVLAAVGETDPQAHQFEKALEFSRFGNMRKMEASLEYDRQLLQPGDVNDPESYKVRRGKIGGYVDYLDPSDIEYADQAMAELDRRFGYQK